MTTTAVALCLAAAARLQQSFQLAKTDKLAQRLLLCAADVIDRTLPAPEIALAAHRRNDIDQVSLLVEQRHLIAAVPEGLWPKRRVSSAHVPTPHAIPLRVLEKALRPGATLTATEKSALRLWLEPALQRYPELRDEVAAAVQ